MLVAELQQQWRPSGLQQAPPLRVTRTAVLWPRSLTERVACAKSHLVFIVPDSPSLPPPFERKWRGLRRLANPPIFIANKPATFDTKVVGTGFYQDELLEACLLDGAAGQALLSGDAYTHDHHAIRVCLHELMVGRLSRRTAQACRARFGDRPWPWVVPGLATISASGEVELWLDLS